MTGETIPFRQATRRNATAPKRLSDIQHTDELHNMKHRLHGLKLLISAIDFGSAWEKRDGVKQVVQDVVAAMEKCAEAFEAERLLRRKEKAS